MMNRNKMIQRISLECFPIIYLLDQVNKKFAPILLVCGKQRIGKSNYALSLASVLSWILNDEEYNVDKYVYFNALEFMKKFITERRKIFIIDEASKDLSKSDWYTTLNQVLSKIIETQADLHNIFIIVLPHASRLATQHKIYVNMKIVMTARGKAEWIYMKQKYGELSSDIKKIVKNIWCKKWELPLAPLHLIRNYEALATKRKREIASEEVGSLRAKQKDWMCLGCNHMNKKTATLCSKCGLSK